MNRYIPMEEDNIRICGRTKAADPLPLFWSGSGIEFVTDGGELSLELESDYAQYEQWIRVEVNGYTAIRTSLQKGVMNLVVFRGFNAGDARTIRVYKEVQAMPADQGAYLAIRAVLTDGQLLPLPKRDYRIEFVGDSITSGEGLGGAKATNSWASAIFSTNGEYGLQVGERMNAEVNLLSQSGWGTACAWDNTPEGAMPLYYEQVCGVISGSHNESLGATEAWDFSKWQADAVVVNLGTNDGAAFEQPPHLCADGTYFKQEKNPDGTYEAVSLKRFTDAVYAFLIKLRKNNPTAKLLWVYGMIGTPLEKWLRESIEKYKADYADTEVELLILTEMCEETMAANGHPGVPNHRQAAESIAARLKEWLA